MNAVEPEDYNIENIVTERNDLQDELERVKQSNRELLAALKALARAIPNGEHLADMVGELDQAESAIANAEGRAE